MTGAPLALAQLLAIAPHSSPLVVLGPVSDQEFDQVRDLTSAAETAMPADAERGPYRRLEFKVDGVTFVLMSRAVWFEPLRVVR